MKNIIIIILLSLSLQGCIFVAGAAAGAAGIAVVYDHRKIAQIAEDQRISKAIYDKFQADPQLSSPTTHIAICTFNNVVLLTGQTTAPSLAQKAEALARDTAGVNRVYNQITIKGPSSSLTRASDSWLTTKIKTQLLATKGLHSGSIKVVSENGNVYLMGVVTHEQADIAVSVAREVSGVQRVIKVFQYKD